MPAAHHHALHLPAAWLPAIRRVEQIGAAAFVTVLVPAVFAACIVAGLLLAMALAPLT